VWLNLNFAPLNTKGERPESASNDEKPDIQVSDQSANKGRHHGTYRQNASIALGCWLYSCP
jgi:hypothetical protein